MAAKHCGNVTHGTLVFTPHNTSVAVKNHNVAMFFLFCSYYSCITSFFGVSRKDWIQYIQHQQFFKIKVTVSI